MLAVLGIQKLNFHARSELAAGTVAEDPSLPELYLYAC